MTTQIITLSNRKFFNIGNGPITEQGNLRQKNKIPSLATLKNCVNYRKSGFLPMQSSLRHLNDE